MIFKPFSKFRFFSLDYLFYNGDFPCDNFSLDLFDIPSKTIGHAFDL